MNDIRTFNNFVVLQDEPEETTNKNLIITMSSDSVKTSIVKYFPTAKLSSFPSIKEGSKVLRKVDAENDIYYQGMVITSTENLIGEFYESN